MRNIHFVICLCVLLMACSSNDGGPSLDSGSSQRARSVPGGTISMTSANGGFNLTTTVPTVSTLEVLTGTDYATAVPVYLTQTIAGTWHGSGANGNILVRLTLADGSVIESGAGDFSVP